MAMKYVKELSQINRLWFAIGAICGLSAVSISYGSVTPTPSVVPSHITDDTALYQQLSEIKVRKESNPSFDQDIQKLAQSEGRYHERLPILSRDVINAPMSRIAKTRYRYAGRKVSPQASAQASKE